MRTSLVLLMSVLLLSSMAQAQTPAGATRTWTDIEGRSIKAALIKVEGDNVTLQLESGSTATVPLARFSPADRAFVQTAQGAKPTAPPTTGPLDPKTPLAWPETVSVAPKDLDIKPGEQNAADRRYIYQSSSFQFVSNAPLASAVMREIAGDFELTHALFLQLPWGWKPRPPKAKSHFEARLYESEQDYVAAGGTPQTNADSNSDFILTKFSSLGLKKVGERYAYDTKSDREGNLTSMISRLMIGDMRSFLFPWSSSGLEEFLRRGCYRNNSFALGHPHNAIKQRIEDLGRSGYAPDLDRMLAFLRSQSGESPSNTELFLDGMLLVFYFGYLDDDGKGTRLHQYYRAAAQDALIYRAFEDAGRKTANPIIGGRTARAAELTKIVIAGRTDVQLREEMSAKFKAIGIKF